MNSDSGAAMRHGYPSEKSQLEKCTHERTFCSCVWPSGERKRKLKMCAASGTLYLYQKQMKTGLCQLCVTHVANGHVLEKCATINLLVDLQFTLGLFKDMKSRG